jgi:hypothetical protein
MAKIANERSVGYVQVRRLVDGSSPPTWALPMVRQRLPRLLQLGINTSPQHLSYPTYIAIVQPEIACSHFGSI